MARRKQRRPRHFESTEDLAMSLQNGLGSSSDTEDDEHVCGRCRAEFPSLSDFLQHKKRCASKRPVLLALDLRDDTNTDDEDDDDAETTPTPRAHGSSLLLLHPDTNVTLEELKNTTVAVAQHKQIALRDFFLRFQQKQVESMQLIQTIQNIILKSGLAAAPPPLVGTAALTPPQSADSAPDPRAASYPQGSKMHHAPGSPPPDTPNSLELLEKHAERYLQDSMTSRRHSFMLNGGGVSETKRPRLDGDPGQRHRCHFCGKLLGSDSALKIHLRSHTGEKPFKCAVCDSSFSTRGNLKVHCQRHRERTDVGAPPATGEAKGPEERGPAQGLFAGDAANRASSPKSTDQALDFSTTMSGRRSPPPQGDATSRSLSPNDTSNFSDNSVDGSLDDYGDLKIDVERYDDDDERGSNSGGGDVPLSPSPFDPSPSFANYFLPSNGTSNTAATNNGSDASAILTQDPIYYQDLLPRAGSNDNSWESLIEVTKTSETSKLQQLVDNIEHKLIEPNQCIICSRVLSCKSALQMHYRTHTGERPFKCKLCSRAFTTKGNLKTHMGVHRVKPPARVMHQCPVCHKQFANTLELQQHIRSHTGDPGYPQLFPGEDRPPTLLPPSYPRQFLVPPQLINAEPLALTNASKSHQDTVIKNAGGENGRQQVCVSPASSHASSSSPLSHSEDASKDPKPPVLDLVQPLDATSKAKSPVEQPDKDPSRNTSRNATPVETKVDYEDTKVKQEEEQHTSPRPDPKSPPKLTEPSLVVSLASDRPLPMTLPSDCPIPFSVPGSYPAMPVTTTEYTASLAALENHVKAINSSVTHPLPFPPHFGLGLSYYRDFPQHQPPFPKSSTSSPSAAADADERSVKSDSPPKSAKAETGGALDLTPRGFQQQQQRGGGGGGGGGGELKMFAPLAGLPFPPPTHHRLGTTCRVCYKTFACQSALEIHYRSHTKERPFRCEVCDRGFSTKGNMRQHMLTHKIRDLPAQVFSGKPDASGERSPKKPSEEKAPAPPPPPPPPARPEQPKPPPAQPRAPGQPKHMCQVCNKPFSSGSALQIHMRTHTGDKPFQCHICHRAFTTKGNLKVHMGTHMWNNSTSRRGRRMSLDLGPLQLPPAAGAPSQPRPELFFPYLPAYVNGLAPPPPPQQQPPKMNEISVIQTATGNGGPVPLVAKPKEDVPNHATQGKDVGAYPVLPPNPEASWPWKISCNVCSKICASSTELEVHVRSAHASTSASSEPPQKVESAAT